MKMELKLIREKVLSDCPPDEAFWTCNATICRNIYELVNNIKSLNKEAFVYHVNTDREKNDFAIWIECVLNDKELALRLKNIMDKERYVDIIEQRIKELENA